MPKTQQIIDILVHCPKCETGFYRSSKDIGKKEKCGVCLSTVLFKVIASNKKPLKIKKSHAKKTKKRK